HRETHAVVTLSPFVERRQQPVADAPHVERVIGIDRSRTRYLRLKEDPSDYVRVCREVANAVWLQTASAFLNPTFNLDPLSLYEEPSNTATGHLHGHRRLKIPLTVISLKHEPKPLSPVKTLSALNRARDSDKRIL